ncbi:hypothetical protein LCGC14_0692810 [marine sediment metagenome]|uniref:Uncharacterized protein n=1 Tax=marine sediment metagenome TaxID=412755 RepID=A0A0F9QPW1_9ZZZZ
MPQRRRPIVPHRRRPVVPSQTDLSVQDVADYSTLAGAASANEEMRRLRLAIKDVEVQVDEVRAPVLPDAHEPDVLADWAQTYMHNGEKVVGKEVQLVNFIDGNGVEFQLTRGTNTANKSYVNVIQGATRQVVNISARLGKSRMAVGEIFVNQLPLDPATRPGGDPSSNDYIYEKWGYTPTNGYQGWPVHGLIHHNFGLVNINDYVIHLTDLQDIDGDGLTDQNADGVVNQDDKDIWHALHFELQENHPQINGLTPNTIILRSIYKPDKSEWFGIPQVWSLYYVDAPNRIVRTNISFRYVIIPKL